MYSTSMRANGRRRAISGAAAMCIVVLILAVGIGAYIYFPPASSIGGQTTTGVAGNQPGKIAFNIFDPLAASGNNAPTFSILAAAPVVVGGVTYNAGQSIETITISSSGAGTSANYYPAGASLWAKESLSNYLSAYFKFTAPGATTAQVQGGQWPTITVLQPHLPTVSVSLTDGSGNVYASSGKDINFTNSGACTSGNNCLGVTSTVLTFTITNTAANTGYISTMDPVNNVNWCLAGVINEATTGSPNKATYSGMPVGFTVGSQRFYGTYLNNGYSSVPAGAGFTGSNSACSSSNISSGGLTQQTQGTTTSGGSVSFKFTVGVGSLTHGNTIADSFKIWEYADLTYAQTNSGVLSPSAVQLGSTFTFTFSA